MFNTPTDCYNYIIENDLEMPVLGAMMNHVGGYSIAEIADGRFHNSDGAVSFSSQGYKINIPVTDDEIVTAVLNGLYVSAFLSRNQDKYQIHFLVSGYPVDMKCRYEEHIAKGVVKYMIMSTIVACRLDSEKNCLLYTSPSPRDTR